MGGGTKFFKYISLATRRPVFYTLDRMETKFFPMKITAICPTANRVSWIPLAIECFLAQTFTDAELLIVDDGFDNTASVIPDDPRIRYVKLDPYVDPQLRPHRKTRSTGLKRNICCEMLECGKLRTIQQSDCWMARCRGKRWRSTEPRAKRVWNGVAVSDHEGDYNG